MNNSCSTQRPANFREAIKSWDTWRPLLGIVIGGLAGFILYRFIGCSTGSCAITRSPLNTSAAGALIGFLIAGPPCLRSAVKRIKKENSDNENDNSRDK